MNYKSTAIISAALLILFLLPYMWKLKDIALIVVLALGVFFAIYDFVLSTGEKPNLQPQHAPYEQEST